MNNIASEPAYPVRLSIAYQERQSRWKAALRLPLGLPLIFFTWLLQGGVTVAIWLTILVRGSIPRWLFDYQVGLNRWQVRTASYLLLLTDEYPPFDGSHATFYEVDYPDRLSRWKLIVWKFATAIPHLVVVGLLSLTLIFVTPIAWFALLITGRYPVSLHRFATGVLRWQARVSAYVVSLTDDFPPYSTSADAASPPDKTQRISTGVGLTAFVLLVVGIASVFTLFTLRGGQDLTREVSYERLVAGNVTVAEASADIHSGRMVLRYANDPAGSSYDFLQPAPDSRLVEFGLSVTNWRGAGEKVPIRRSSFTLKDSRGLESEPLLGVSEGDVAPADINSGDSGEVLLVFEVANGARPEQLRWDVLNYIDFPRVGETITWVFR